MKRILASTGLLVVALGLMFGLNGSAQAAELLPNSKEVRLMFHITNEENIDGESETVWALDTALGWVLRGGHEPGVIITYQDPIPLSGDDASGGTFGLFYLYNFSAGGIWIPYVGTNVQSPFSDLKDLIDFRWEVVAGTRLMPGERASMNLELFYNQETLASDLTGSDPKNLGLRVGVSIFFGGRGE